VAGLEPAVSAF